MALSDDIKTLMMTITPLTTLLTGGVFSSTDLKSAEGIHPDVTPTAFDANGKLKPCALVIERAEVADGWVRDFEEGIASTVQGVMITLYQHLGWDKIDPGLGLLYLAFEGYDFVDGRQMEFERQIPRLPREAGALKNSSCGRIDFLVYGVKGA